MAEIRNYYYYIPKEHESIVNHYQAQWLSSDPKKQTIMTGYYTQSIVQALEDTINTNVTNQAGVILPYSYTSFIDGSITKYVIIAFLLEGVMPPNIEEIALSLEGVKRFDTAKELRDYLGND